MMKLVLPLLFSSFSLTYGSMNLWADVGFIGKYDFEELDYRLGFMMDNYNIISLEKCLWEKDPTERTEDVFQRLTKRMRELRPNSKSKILFYWHVTIMYKCYHSIDYLMTRPDLWLYDSNGKSIRNVNHKPMLDYRIPEAFDFWVSSAAKVVEQCEGRCQGVWLDGIGHVSFKGWKCGENEESKCDVDPETVKDWNDAQIRAIGTLRNRLHELDPSNILTGNDVSNEEDMGKLTAYIDVLDGFARDHFMTFWEVDAKAVKQPFVRPEKIENFVKVRDTILKANKTLLLRGSPGPVKNTPRVRISTRFLIPSLPDHYNYPQPRTIKAVQQSYKDLLNYPLAVYLCGFADPNVYFSYHLGHVVKMVVPCHPNPAHCFMPPDLDQLFKNDPGSPLTDPMWTGRTCTRQFENYGVSVNIEDENSVMWLPKSP